MAFTFGFYNAIDHDRVYDAVQFGSIFDGVITDGVYEHYKGGMLVRESSRDNEVIVSSGRAWFNHTWNLNDGDRPVSLPVPEVASERIDAVVIDINARIDIRANSIGVISGTPAAKNPNPPNMVRSDYNNQYPLAYIHRYPGQQHVYTRDIQNMVGTSLCPFVTGVVEGLTIDQLLAQWWDQFDHSLNVRIAQYDAWKRGIETDYNSWFNNTKNTYNSWFGSAQSDYTSWRNNIEADFQAWFVAARLDFAAWRQARENEFFTWMETQKSSYADFLAHNSTAWANWFNHIQTELDGDVAGHLQNQIDRISYMYVIDNVLYLPNTGASLSGNKLILTNHN